MSLSANHTNFAKSTLASGIASDATALTMATGTGALFPTSGYFLAVIWGAAYSDPQADTSREIVNCHLSSGDGFVIDARHEEGTTAKAWSTGDKIAHDHTAGKANEIETAINSGWLAAQIFG